VDSCSHCEKRGEELERLRMQNAVLEYENSRLECLVQAVRSLAKKGMLREDAEE